MASATPRGKVKKKDGGQKERAICWSGMGRTRERPGPFSSCESTKEGSFSKARRGASPVLVLAACQLSYPSRPLFERQSRPKSSALARVRFNYLNLQILSNSTPQSRFEFQRQPHPVSRRHISHQRSAPGIPVPSHRTDHSGQCATARVRLKSKIACCGALSRHYVEQEIRLQAKGKGCRPPPRPWIWVSEFSAPLTRGTVGQDTSSSTAGIILIVAAATCPALSPRHPCRYWHLSVERWSSKEY